MIVGKYEFESSEIAGEEIEKILELNIKCDIVQLGYILISAGKYKRTHKGELVAKREPVYSDKYHVDVLWRELDECPKEWNDFSVNVEGEGSHSFAGIKYKN